MNKQLKQNLLILAASLCILPASAQLSSNPDKFLGNITTDWPGSVDYDGLKYSDYWNQVTPENGTKWGTVEGTRGSYYWDGADPAFNYAKNHGFPFKFHTLILGSQFPNWFKDLSLSERYGAILNWMDVVKKKYPNLHMIDVANEAVEGHQPDTPIIKAALGGGGKTGYDWLIKAFEMAYERWPDAILIYNDFNTFSWQIKEYINLVRALRDAGAPIDAYGNQAHDLGGKTTSVLQSVMKQQQDSLKMPMYISEYDIQDANDANQKWNYQQHIPLMWEAEYCAGVTLWGWIYGHTWMENTSGLIKNKQERSALTWLREYMQTDAAKNAKSPYPGMKKEASIYVHPAALKVAKGDVLPIKVRASMATKMIERIDVYVGNELIATLTEAPYITEYNVPSTATSDYKTLKAVVTATDGYTYERYGRFQVLSNTTKREPYNEAVPELPGTINTGEFDKGASGVSYSGVSTTVYNSRDMFSTTATQTGAWMEYTVDVTEDGFYTLEAEVASEKDGGSFHLAEYTFDNLKFLTEFAEVPKTGGTTEFQTLRCPVTEYLTAGRHVFTLLIDKGGFYVKELKFKHVPTFTMPGAVVVRDLVRSEGVEIKTTAEGNVLTMDNADWTEYLVDVTLNNNKYSYELAASSVTGASVSMTLIDSDGNEKSLGTVSVPNTGSLDTYQVKKGKIRNTLNEGKQTLRITMKSGSCNIASLNFTNTEATGIDELEDNDAAITGDTYNLSGQKVDAAYRGIVIRNGKKMIKK